MLCLALLILAVSSHCHASLETVSKDIVLNQVERSIDLTSQLVKISTKLTLANVGQSPVKSFHYVLEGSLANHVAFIGATTGSNSKTYLSLAETKLKEHTNASAWRVELKKAIGAGSEQVVEVEVFLSKALRLHPEQITQREKQMVLFVGNHYLFAPYLSKSQVTKVTLASSAIESYSKHLKPTSLSEAVITYGPYTNVAAFSMDVLSVHFENNNPFLTVAKLQRTIELSMWGNIAVEETIDLHHSGAKLKGPFSRYEYQREKSGLSSVNRYKTILPASASNVYYRDDIGIISTSSIKNLDEAVELDLRPRFPLFGGWKTHYTIGYNVPSYEYLFHKDDTFLLNMRLLDHVCDDMVVEEFSLQVILPEGSVIEKLSTPYPMTREADSKHFTYLDIDGRVVLNLRSPLPMTEKHIQDFQLQFHFPRMWMLREPLMLIAAFMAFFLLAIVYVRLDFAITKDEGVEAKLKISGICSKILSHHDKRMSFYSTLDEAMSKAKSSKDVAAFQAAIKKANADAKNESRAISELQAILKTLSAEQADKVAELQKSDGVYREHQANLCTLIDKLVSGKMGKQQFVDSEAAIQDKCKDSLDKMCSVVLQLRP